MGRGNDLSTSSSPVILHAKRAQPCSLTPGRKADPRFGPAETQSVGAAHRTSASRLHRAVPGGRSIRREAGAHFSIPFAKAGCTSRGHWGLFFGRQHHAHGRPFLKRRGRSSPSSAERGRRGNAPWRCDLRSGGRVGRCSGADQPAWFSSGYEIFCVPLVCRLAPWFHSMLGPALGDRDEPALGVGGSCRKDRLHP